MEKIINSTDANTKLTVKEKLGYSLGEFANQGIYGVISVYLLFFFTDVLGIAAAIAGTIFLVVRIWDTVIDPPIGVIVDRTQTRWGKFRPFIMFGAIPLALTTVLCFYAPNLNTTGKIVYALLIYVAYSTAYSLVTIPYSALTAVITQDYQERNSVSTFRMIFSMVGSLAAAMAIQPMVNIFSGFTSVKNSYIYAVSIFVALCLLFYFVCFKSVKERVKPESDEKYTIKQLLQPLFQNRPLLFLIIASFATNGAFNFRIAALLYYFKYYVNNMDFYVLAVLTAYVAVILGMFVTPFFTKRFEKRTVFIGGVVLALIGSVALWFAPINNLPVLLLFVAFSTFGGGAPTVLFVSMLADCVEYGEWKTGVRAAGAVNAAYSFTNNLAFALSGGFLGLYLAWIGYVPNVAQTQLALNGLRATQSLVLAGFNIISIVAICFFTINSKFFKKIVDEINARKTGHVTKA